MRALQHFLEDVREKNLMVLYAQVRQGGDVIDYWSRLGQRKSDGLTSYSGLTRLESYSTAKTFSGFGIGLALDAGLIRLDEKVADSFPEYTYNITNPYALNVTVQDMLMMSTGLEETMFFRDSPERAREKDWGRYFYQTGKFVRPSGTQFKYCNINTYMLGRLVARKSGERNLLEYMRYRLFEPLGIGNPDMTTCPMGHTVGANGMAINVDEMGHFGEMILRGGEYKGKRILSEAFVKDATAKHLVSDQLQYTDDKDGLFDYGYHIWVDSVHKCCALTGILGQFCVIAPEKDAVITVMSLEEDERLVGKLLWEDILAEL